MSLWLDMLGAEIRFVDTKSFGRTRIAEAGRKDLPALFFLHGIGGHLEAYAKNVVALSDRFHVIAYDYVGHGLSAKQAMEYTPIVLAGHLGELMTALGIEHAHLSGESLGGWVSGFFAVRNPARVDRLILNTAAGLPVISEKGKQDLEALRTLSQKAATTQPSYESVQGRMRWLFHPDNYAMISDELIHTRLSMYLQPEMREIAPRVLSMIGRHDEFLIPLAEIRAETLFLWTVDNPVHDVDTARISSTKVPRGQLYVMKAEAAHWPQYEAPEEFNTVTTNFLTTGRI